MLSANDWARVATVVHAVILHATVGASFFLVLPELRPLASRWPLPLPTRNDSPSLSVHPASRRLLRWTLGLLLPSGLVWWVTFQIAQPDTAGYWVRHFWPLLLLFGTGCVVQVLCTTAWVLGKARLPLRWRMGAGGLAVLAALVALVTAANLESLSDDPQVWLESPYPARALVSVRAVAQGALHVLAALSVGGALVLHWLATVPKGMLRTSWIARSVCAASTAGVLLALCASAWLSPLPSLAQPGPDSGVQLWIAAVFAWSTLGLGVVVFRNPSPTLALANLGVALVVVVFGRLAMDAHLHPWAVRGHLYANGVMTERVRTLRRSTFLPDPDKESAPAGPMMFAWQCGSCHTRCDVQRRLADRKGPWIRDFVEDLREADRPGHPYRSTMPPLVGDEAKVEALASWLAQDR